MSSSPSAVNVCVRVRSHPACAGQPAVTVRRDASRGGRAEVRTADGHVFQFDAAAGEATTQDEVFDTVGRPILDAILNGFNATIFAYGQTGTGKTYSMGILDRGRRTGRMDEARQEYYDLLVSHLSGGSAQSGAPQTPCE